jgi:hypothetical protein
MNILIKLMSIVSLVIAPTLSGMFHDQIQESRMQKLGTMMSACKTAGCTEAQCASIMSGTGAAATKSEKSCCSGDKAASCSGESEECKATCGGTCDKAICDKPCCATESKNASNVKDTTIQGQ